MAKYNMITTVELQDNEGNTMPAETVINTIEWDGIAAYTPPANTKLELVEE